MSHSKRIVISGYYGFSNAGDEAVLSAIVRGLKSQANVEITVLSASPEETAETHGVHAVPRMSWPKVTRALKDCDLLISGGGSLIQDATSLRSLIYYLAIISLAKRYRRKVMILGQGIGPLRRGISRRLVKKSLSGVDLITVRDAQSAEILAGMGIPDASGRAGPVKVTADPTFTLEPCSEEEAKRLLARIGVRGDAVAVSIRGLRRGLDQPGIVEALRTLAKDLPAQIVLVGMQSPDDLDLVRKIGDEVGTPFQTSAWTPEQLLGVIAICGLVVGMRLHALIFAASAGVPFVGIEYDPKVEQFVKAAGQEGIGLHEIGSLADKARKAWDARDELALKLSEPVAVMRPAAAENMRLATDLLSD